eukprot:gene5308-8926_t
MFEFDGPLIEDGKACENCDENFADFYCENCSMIVCEGCSNVIHKKKKDHNIKLIDDKSIQIKKKIVCQTHEDSEVYFFCITHKEFICPKCVLVDFNGKHINCKRIKIDEVPDFCQDQKKQLDKIEEDLSKEIILLENYKSKTEEILKKIIFFQENLNESLNIVQLSKRSKIDDQMILVYSEIISKLNNVETIRMEYDISLIKLFNLSSKEYELYETTFYQQKVVLVAVDYETPSLGSKEKHEELAKTLNLKMPTWTHLGDGKSFSTSHKKSKDGIEIYTNIHQYYETYLKKKYDFKIYTNLLFLQGTKQSGWAHNAENGCFGAFGGPKGNSFSYCRNGDICKKRLHVYLFFR